MDPDTVTVTFTVRIEENQAGTLLKALRLEEEGPFSGDLDKISLLREAIRAKGEATTTVRFPIPGKDPPWTLRLELERSNGRMGLAEAKVKPHQAP